MKRLVLFITIWVILLSSLQGQTLHYDVTRGGESMGFTEVERIFEGDKITYHLYTKVQFRVLFLFKVEYDLVETFEEGTLEGGKGFNTLNGNIQKETVMTRKPNFYELVIDGIRTEVNEPSIQESVSEIYFEEPYDDKKVYSAYFARYLYFDKVGEHQYSLTSPDGTNVYTYENEIVTEVKVTRDFANFRFILKPESLAAVRDKKITGSK